MFKEQCKGKDLIKVPKSKLAKKYYCSLKYDGHYCQIHKHGDIVKFYTSGGKEFYIKSIADFLVKNNTRDFILECEFLGEGDGFLGERGKGAKLTTYRTQFTKGLDSTVSPNDKFIVFDIIDYDLPFAEREKLMYYITLPASFARASNTLNTLEEALILSEIHCSTGSEGVFLKTPDHMQREGKRVNDAIKIKKRPTADLTCVGVVAGRGKYEGMIGSLTLTDSEGRYVDVGSGICDTMRDKTPEHYIGKIIEISYEQIQDTYIQPVFLGIRRDKTVGD